VTVKIAELIRDETRIPEKDLPWPLRRDGFAQINPMTIVYPLFYHRHVSSPPVYVDAPQVVQFPWVVTKALLYQCPVLMFDCADSSLDGTELVSETTNPYILVVLPNLVIKELQGREVFAFAVPRSEIKSYMG
jgi:hypothetical protein